MLNIYESDNECFISKNIDIDDFSVILVFLIVFAVIVLIGVISLMIYAIKSI